MLSALSFLCVTERHRPKATANGFAVPVVMESIPAEGSDPLLVSNTKGQFVVTRRTREGNCRFGMFHCPLEEEDRILLRLFSALQALGTEFGWGNYYPNIQGAMDGLTRAGKRPGTVILAKDFTRSSTNFPDGAAPIVQGIRFLTGPLPQQSAIVAIEPQALGVYTRVGDYLGLQFANASQALLLVGPDGNLAG